MDPPHSPPGGGEAWTDFGQRVDLTARLREILINYPEGTSILKELVQNADDAKATRIAFCLDRRSHPTGTLLGPGVAAFQGPALLAYNDAVFSEQDFESISRIGDSVKRAQAGKTGRFGVGFNSIYHLTDLPSFVSGRHLVIFDPHCKYVPNISSSNPGKKIDFVSHREAVQQYRDQLLPYQGAFGCNPLGLPHGGAGVGEAGGGGTVSEPGGPWPATLFRFPLRSEAQAASSNISKQVYDVDKAGQLLQGLLGEAHLMMLFLKTITSIQVYDWAPGQASPSLLYSCIVANQSAALQQERTLFARVSALAMQAAPAPAAGHRHLSGGAASPGDHATVAAAATAAAARLHQGFASSFQLHLTTTTYAPSAPSAPTAPTASTTRRFLVSQASAGGPAAETAAELSRLLAAPLVPWGAVAADISPPVSKGHQDSDAAAAPVAAPAPGRAFCFLPLPTVTGLPLHVNAFFELSSNRRDVWHGSDLAGAGAQRAAWNLLLLERAVAPAYASLLEVAATLLGPGAAYDRLWPAANVQAPWQALVPALYRLVSDRPVAWTGAGGGRWLPPVRCLLPDARCTEGDAPAAASSGGQGGEKGAGGAAPREDGGAGKGAGSGAPRGRGEVLRGALVKAGLPLLGLPPAVGAMMAQHMLTKPRVVTPDLARSALRQPPASQHPHPQHQSSPAPPIPSPSLDAASDVPALLDYCLSDVVPVMGAAGGRGGGGVAPQARVVVDQVEGLPLLPLLSGSVTVLHSRVQMQRNQQSSLRGVVLLPDATELQLFSKHAPHLLLDTSCLSDDTAAKLTALADSSLLNLALPDARAAAQLLLPLCLPRTPADGTLLPISEDGTGGTVARPWLQLLWQWLSRQPPGSLRECIGLPLLPVRGGTALLPLLDRQAGTTAILEAQQAQQQEGGMSALMAVLVGLGCHAVDAGFPGLPAGELLRAGFAHPLTGLGALQALHAVHALHASQQSKDGAAAAGAPPPWLQAAGKLPSERRALLRSFLLQEDCLAAAQKVSSGTSSASGAKLPPLLALLASLPIFESAAVPRRSAQRRQPAEETSSTAAGAVATAAAGPTSATVDWDAAPAGGGAAAPSPPPGGGASVAAGSAGQQPQHVDRDVVFVDLSGNCFLEPPGFDASPILACYGSTSGSSRAAVAPKYVRASGGHAGSTGGTAEQQGALLAQYLGVTAIAPEEMYKQHLLSLELASLLTGQRDAAFLQLLQQLPLIHQYSPTAMPAFTKLLRATAFVPDGEGVLHLPSQLYDPRNPDLLALLDPATSFPSDVFCGDNSSDAAAAPSALHALQLLGLQSVAGPDALLKAARYVERLAAEAQGQPGQQAQQGAEAPGAAAAAAMDLDMAVARGMALLAYLEVEAGRLMAHAVEMGFGGAGSAAGAGASTEKGPGGGGPGALVGRLGLGLLSKVSGLFREQQGQGQGQAGAAATAAGVVGEEQAAAARRFWSDLARIAWCPALPDPPVKGLPWPSVQPQQPPPSQPLNPSAGVSTANSNALSQVSAVVAAPASRPRLAAPRLLRPAPDMWLCSALLGVLDGECRSSALAAGLGWSLPLTGGVLATQLLELGSMHARVTDEGLARVLAGVVPQLYRVISELPEGEFEVARSMLHGSRCVWVGNGFALASKVAFKGSLDLSPWLYVIPSDLAPFRELLLQLGASPAFSPAQYTMVLQDMHAASVTTAAATADASPLATARASPLGARQLAQAIAVVQALADLNPPGSTGGTGGPMRGTGGGTGDAYRLYVPDERGVLSPLSELAFNDAPWLGASSPTPPGVRLVHPMISNLVAERVGVASLRRLLIVRSSDALALASVPGSAAEAFGQSEALTTRLRHIIQDYPEGAGILLELLQNADDAGARHLSLLLDCNTYPSDSTLGPAMAAWQGPALLAHNDAVFSPQDFANISRIGQDSKMGRPAATGRFGLGFNCVYHFTDVPSFVSGDYLVTFDPHARYLPGVNPAQPGIKIAFRHADLASQFPDAAAPYLHFGCTLRDRYGGTLFRFPLRSRATAEQSDIKPQTCSTDQVVQLFRAFQAQLPSALLFLKSVRKVSVWIKAARQPPPAAAAAAPAPAPAAAAPTGSSDGSAAAATAPVKDPGPKLLFEAEAEVPAWGSAAQQACQSLQAPITQFITQPAACPGTQANSESGAAAGGKGAGAGALLKALGKVRAEELPCEVGPLELTMRVARGWAPKPGPAVLVPASDGPAGALGAAEAGGEGAGAGVEGAAAQVAGEGAGDQGMTGWSESWVVCNALSGGRALLGIAAGEAAAGGAKMIPWVGVAARLPSQQGGSPVGTSPQGSPSPAAGRAFCFLPLPLPTGLPLHVNAFFELSSNRRDVWHDQQQQQQGGGGGQGPSDKGSGGGGGSAMVMSGSGAARARWNEALLSDALGPAYARLLLELSSALAATSTSPAVAEDSAAGALDLPEDGTLGTAPGLRYLYACFPPPPASLREPWAALSRAFYQRALPSASLLWTDAQGGRWLPPSQVLLVSPDDDAVSPRLIRLLVALGLPVACGLPTWLEGLLLTLPTPGAVRLTPGLVRRHLARAMAARPLEAALLAVDPPAKAPMAAAAATAASAAGSAALPPPPPASALLLNYCLSDCPLDSLLPPSSSSSSAPPSPPPQLAELHALPLLLLSDGTLGPLLLQPATPALTVPGTPSPLSTAPHHYLLLQTPLEEQLLAGVRGLCVSPHGLPSTLQHQFGLLARSGLVNISPVTPASLDSLVLPRLLPSAWRLAKHVRWNPAAAPSTSSHPAAASDGASSAGGAVMAGAVATATVTAAATAGAATTAGAVAAAPTAVAAGAAAPGVPSADWVRLLWTWLWDRPAGEVAALRSWPVLPIRGGWLHCVTEGSQVLVEGGWTEGVTHALLQLGCMLLDTAAVAGRPSALPSSQGAGPFPSAPVPGSSPGAVPSCLAGIVQPPTLDGVLSALAAAAATFSGTGPGSSVASGSSPGASSSLVPSAAWAARLHGLGASDRRQLRAFLLQARWFPQSGTDSGLSPSRLALLKSLPIYEVHSGSVQASTPAAGATASDPAAAAAAPSEPPSGGAAHFTSLTPLPSHTTTSNPPLAGSPELLLPPLLLGGTVALDPRLLPPSVLRFDSDVEAGLAERCLGVKRLGAAEFGDKFLVQQAAHLPRDAIAALALSLARALAPGAAASPPSPHPPPDPSSTAALAQALARWPIFPSAGGRLCLARDLCHPDVPALLELMDAEDHFPGGAFAKDPSLLRALEMLGLRREVDLQVLVSAAADVSARYMQMQQEGDGLSRESLAAAAVAEAASAAGAGSAAPAAGPTEAAASEPHGQVKQVLRLLSRSKALLRLLDAHCSTKGTGLDGADAGASIASAWAQLASLSWCPVMRTPPEPGLPWPSSQPLLAPPRTVRPAADAWLVSATLSLLPASHPPGPALSLALGWSGPPRTAAVAAQLLSLSSSVTAASVTGEEAVGKLEAAMHRIYAALTSALDGPGADLVEMSLGREGTACVWVGPPPPPPAPSPPATGGLPVGTSSEPAAAATAAETQHEAQQEVQHKSEEEKGDAARTAVLLVSAQVSAIDGDDGVRPWLYVVPPAFRQYGRLLGLLGVAERHSAEQYAAALARMAMAAGPGGQLGVARLAAALRLAEGAATAQRAYGRPSLPLLLPDASCRLVPASSLLLNDAPWLDPPAGMLLAHPDLPQATVQALGVRSLRGHHEEAAGTGTRAMQGALPCPMPQQIQDRLAQDPDPCLSALWQLLQLADQLSAPRLHLALDHRSHPAQSLLHPGLARFQGPALCATLPLPGAALSPEQLSELMAAPKPGTLSAVLSTPPATLLGCFALSAVPAAISGTATMLWDPSGQVLTPGAGPSTSHASHADHLPRAKQYSHGGSGTGPDLLSAFQDQYAPFHDFALHPEGLTLQACAPLEALLIRLPLAGDPRAAPATGQQQQQQQQQQRQQPGVEGVALKGATVAEVESALRELQAQAARSLLFLGRVEEITVTHIRSADAPGATSLGSSAAGTAAEMPSEAPSEAEPLLGPEAAAADRAADGPCVEVAWHASVAPADPRQARLDPLAVSSSGASSSQRGAGPGAGAGSGHRPGLGKQLLNATLGRVAGAGQVLLSPLVGGGAGQHGGQARAAPGGGHVTRLQLRVAGAVLQASKEQWLVSSCWEDDPPHASGGGGGPAVLSSVAVCLASARQKLQQQLEPQAGLYAPYEALHPNPAVSATAAAVGGPAAPGPSRGQDPAARGAAGQLPPGSHLSRLPFLVSGRFCLGQNRTWGHYLSPVHTHGPHGPSSTPSSAPSSTAAASDLDLLTRLSDMAAAAATAAAAAAAVNSSGGHAPAPAHTTSSELAEQRSRHNLRALDAVASAWAAAVLALMVGGGDGDGGGGACGASDPEQVYRLMPDLEPATRARDETALYCLKKMYVFVSRLPVWRLRRSGRLVALTEGCFLQTSHEEQQDSHQRSQQQPQQPQQQQPSALGPAALSFVLREMALLDVPWPVKTSLEAAGVQGLRVVGPEEVRTWLRGLMTAAARRQLPEGFPADRLVPGPGAGVALPGVAEASQLLRYCCSDLLLPEVAATAQGPASGQAQQQQHVQRGATPAPPQGPASLLEDPGEAILGGLSNMATAWARAIESSGIFNPQDTSPTRALDPNSAGRATGGAAGGAPGARTASGFEIGTAAMAAAVAEALGVGGGGAGAGQQGHQHQHQHQQHQQQGQQQQGLPQQQQQGPTLDPSKLQECRGLPVPNASGVLVPLGSRHLRLIPPGCGANPAALLPPEAAAELLHPDAVQALQHVAREPAFRQALQLAVYCPKDLSRQLRDVLPPAWYRPDLSSPEPGAGQAAQAGQGGQAGLAAAARAGRSGGGAAATETGAFDGLGIGWDNGESEGPAPRWLDQVWELVLGLVEAAPLWHAQVECALSDLDCWPLLPVLGGRLVWLAHRRMLVYPPLGSSSGDGQQELEPSSAPVQLSDLALPALWDVLLPALDMAGLPILDPRFAAQLISLHAPAFDCTGTGNCSALVSKMAWCSEALAAAAGAGATGVATAAGLGLKTWGWTTKQREAMFKLLTQRTPPGPLSPSEKAMLQSLPIYPTLVVRGGGGAASAPLATTAQQQQQQQQQPALGAMAGSRSGPGSTDAGLTSLDNAEGYAACPLELLQQLPGVLATLPPSASRLLLSHRPAYQPLYSLLGVPTLTLPQLLASFIIPHLPSLPDSAQAIILSKVQSDWSRLKSDAALVSALRACPFVLAGTADDDGGSETATGAAVPLRTAPPELYDPGLPLLARVFRDKPVFPAGQFAFPAWLEVLRDCGLVHKVNTATFLAAARELEAQAQAHGLLPPSVGGPPAPASPAPPAAPFLAPSAAQAAVLAAAHALVAHLREHSGSLLGRDFYTALAGLAVVPATFGGVPGSAAARPVLARYGEAAAAKDWALVWTVLPIVQPEQAPPPGVSAHLRLRSPPPLTAVLQHIALVGADGGEDALGSWPASVGPVESAFGALLAHLSREGLSKPQADALTHAPLVPVANATRLAAPAQLFARLPVDLAPFAYEIPASLASHLPLLRTLGAGDAPSARTLLDSLHAMHARLGTYPLNANEAAAVIRLLRYMAGPEAAAAEPPGASGGGAAAAGRAGGRGGSGEAAAAPLPSLQRSAADLQYMTLSRSGGRMLVLTSEARLVPARSAAYVNAPGGAQGRLLGRAALGPGSGITLVHPQIPVGVAAWLGCRALSETVHEELDPGHALVQLQSLPGLSLEQAKAMIQSPSFIRAAYSVHAAYAPLLRGMPPLSLQQVAARLRSAASRLAFVEEIQTRVTMVGGAGAGGGGTARQYEFADAEDSGGRLYIARPPPGLPATWLLAQALSRELGSPGVTLPLQPLLEAGASNASNPGADASNASNGGAAPDVGVLLPGGYDADLERAGQAGQPGAPLLASDRRLLQLRPLRRFCAGEAVAVRRGDLLQAAGSAAAASAAGAASGLTADAASAAALAAERRAARPPPPDGVMPASTNFGDQEDMVYARVAASCGPGEGETVYYVPLEAGFAVGGPGNAAAATLQLLSSQVFCFGSNVGAPAASDEEGVGGASGRADVAQRTGAAASASTQGSGSASGSFAATATAAAAATSQAGWSAQQQAQAQGQEQAQQQQRVGSQHLVSAVKDLLSAAGLPLDLERGALLQQAAALKEALGAAERGAREAAAAAAATAAEAEAARQEWTCKVCFSHQVDCCFSACGHLFCARCASSLGGRCAACRKRGELIRVYK